MIEFDESQLSEDIRRKYDVIGVGRADKCPKGSHCYGFFAAHRLCDCLLGYTVVLYLKPKRRHPTPQDAADGREVVTSWGLKGKLTGFQIFNDGSCTFHLRFKDRPDQLYPDFALYIED